jgi:hypothetical protein
MEAIERISKVLKEEKRRDRRTKFQVCNYCLGFYKKTKYIKKKNYANHKYLKHFDQIKDPNKRAMIAARHFFKVSDKTLKYLDILKVLLSQVIKFKINKRIIVKKPYHKKYKKNIKLLTNILEDRRKNRDEDGINNNNEGDDNDSNNN